MLALSFNFPEPPLAVIHLLGLIILSQLTFMLLSPYLMTLLVRLTYLNWLLIASPPLWPLFLVSLVAWVWESSSTDSTRL
jgi:hypothetical protein